jgi:hypothetical protein
MGDEHTTAAVERYLDELAGGSPAEPVILALLYRAVRRLLQLCAIASELSALDAAAAESSGGKDVTALTDEAAAHAQFGN